MIIEKLAEHGLRLNRYGSGTQKTTCPKCSPERRNKQDQCLSIKIDEDGGAVWKCHHCGWADNIAGNGFANDASRKVEYKKPDPITTPTEHNDKKDGVFRWFEGRGISRETVDAFKIEYAQKSFGKSPEGCIAFPYFFDGEVVNYKYRTHDKKFRQEGASRRTLFNYDEAISSQYFKDKRRLVFVEGEMDVMACYEAGIKNAVSLPDGAPQEAKLRDGDKRFTALEDLPDFDEVVIAVDMDSAGQALAKELEHRFGKHKCSRVKWPALNDVQCKDANECLIDHGAEVLAECLEERTHNPVEGLYRVSDYTEQVKDIYHGNVQQPISTGWDNMDEIYKVMPATFQLVTGIPNHGKSNFLDQLIVQLNRMHGWRFCIFSPEHGVASHVRRLSEKVLSMPFDDGLSPRMGESQLDAAIEKMDDSFYFIESQDALPQIDWILDRASVAIRRFGVRGIVIDPYNMIDSSREGNKREDEHIRDLISRCKSFCRQHDIVMWMVAHPNKMRREGGDTQYQPPSLYDVSGSAHWYNMADVGLVVHRDFESEITRVITRKIREQGLYGQIGEAFFKYDLPTKTYLPA
jgi:twinkle protein